jgi:hypothetical protein
MRRDLLNEFPLNVLQSSTIDVDYVEDLKHM